MAKKHILDVNEKIWKNVLRYKIDTDSKNNNETLLKLIGIGLKKKKKVKL